MWLRERPAPIDVCELVVGPHGSALLSLDFASELMPKNTTPPLCSSTFKHLFKIGASRTKKSFILKYGPTY